MRQPVQEDPGWQEIFLRRLPGNAFGRWNYVTNFWRGTLGRRAVGESTDEALLDPAGGAGQWLPHIRGLEAEPPVDAARLIVAVEHPGQQLGNPVRHLVLGHRVDEQPCDSATTKRRRDPDR